MESEDTLMYKTIAVDTFQCRMHLLKLPEANGGRRREGGVWIFTRMLEWFLYGTTHSSCNLNHLLNELHLEKTKRQITKANCEDEGLSLLQYDAARSVYRDWAKELDPLTSDKSRVLVLIPIQTAIMIVRHRADHDLKCTHILRALGGDVPQQILDEEERRKNKLSGDINLSLPDHGEEDPTADELVGMALGAELMMPFTDGEGLEEEEELGKRYALQSPSAKLIKELERYKLYRVKALNANRIYNAVTKITVESDAANMLRFLGYCKSVKKLGVSLDFSLFRHPDIQDVVQSFAEWLQEVRECRMGTIAGYMNSLLSLANYAIGEIHGEVDEMADEILINSLFNLR